MYVLGGGGGGGGQGVSVAAYSCVARQDFVPSKFFNYYHDKK